MMPIEIPIQCYTIRSDVLLFPITSIFGCNEIICSNNVLIVYIMYIIVSSLALSFLLSGYINC